MSLVSDKPDVCCTRVQHPVASKKDPLESEQAHTVRETHLAQMTQLQPAPLVTSLHLHSSSRHATVSEPDDQPQACAADAVWHLKFSKVLSILASGSYQGDLLRCRSGRCTCAHTTGAACRSCQENAGQQSSIRPCALGRCAWLCKRECNVQSLSRACHHAGEGEGSSWCEEGVAAGRNNRHQGAGCFIGVACKDGRHLRAIWARAPAT